jgi:hypothetical protein
MAQSKEEETNRTTVDKIQGMHVTVQSICFTSPKDLYQKKYLGSKW